MKLALVADIHGNFVSLKAVINDLKTQAIDRVVCLGDVVAFGPQPSECVRALRDLGSFNILGNTDDWVLGDHPFSISEGSSPINAERMDWCQDQLRQSDIDFINSFEPMLSINLNGDLRLLAFHGSPSSYNDIIFPTIEDEQLLKYLSDFDAQFFTGGHTHIRMLRQLLGKTFINPGSVGLPFLTSPMDDPWKMGPFAEYATLEVTKLRSKYEFVQVPIDVDDVIDSAAKSDFPYSEKWIEGWRLGVDAIEGA